MAVEKKKTNTSSKKNKEKVVVETVEENTMIPLAHAFRELYEALQTEGFSEEQSYDLLKTTMASPALTPPRTSLF